MSHISMWIWQLVFSISNIIVKLVINLFLLYLLSWPFTVYRTSACSHWPESGAKQGLTSSVLLPSTVEQRECTLNFDLTSISNVLVHRWDIYESYGWRRLHFTKINIELTWCCRSANNFHNKYKAVRGQSIWNCCAPTGFMTIGRHLVAH